MFIDIRVILKIKMLSFMCPETAMGITLNSQDNEASKYVDAVRRLMNV